MKNYLLSLSALILISCGQTTTKTQAESAAAEPIDFKNASFDEIFVKADPKDIDVNAFKLIHDDWSVVTAGNEVDFNSMIASWGGMGIIFEKPVAWIFLNGSRFTLEKIKEHGSFTLSYLDSTYTDQKMILGTKSGRDTDKMKEITLHNVKTPDRGMTYKEAYMVIELKLESTIELNPDNFQTEDHKKFLIEGKEKGNGKNYHNMVMGVITNVWVKK